MRELSRVVLAAALGMSAHPTVVGAQSIEFDRLGERASSERACSGRQ